mmetsp:Transcript_16029/g.29368  ORF Transcript_16029/g.29368 Transcript_16029/m.29368 type:complete len:219 (-) Transcript_16029:231-887(-)
MELLKRFPSVAYAVQYGSSVLAKPHTGIDTNAQVDLILGVDDPLAWHKANIELNPKDYSEVVLKKGAEFLVESSAQAAGIHYNPYVQEGEKIYKYGVIALNDLINDLNKWETFYIAGRLQKPVKTILSHHAVTPVYAKNLRAASAAAMVCAPGIIEDTDFFKLICQFSYAGDRRLDSVNKVSDIVSGNLDLFKNLYYLPLTSLPGIKIEGTLIHVSFS